MNQFLNAEAGLIEMRSWEDEYFPTEVADVTKSYQQFTNRMFNQLGKNRKIALLSKMDQLLFHFQAWQQQSQSQVETRRRTIQYARIFNEEIDSIDDLRKLSLTKVDYLAEQLMSKQRLLAFGQGGLTGMGGIFLLALDLPAMVLIQLRSLQQLALVYGYDSRRPVEMMYMLKLFHVATLPKSFQSTEWNKLFATIDGQVDDVFYQGDDTIFQDEWMEQLLKQIAKGFLITMMRKKMIQGIPIVGIAVGAGVNYRFSQQVIEIGQHFYQKRRLLEELNEVKK